MMLVLDMFCYVGDMLSVDGDAAAEAREYARDGIRLDSFCICLPIRSSHFL